MSRIVVIDTETTWTDEVMSIGAVIADGRDFSVNDSRYYLIDPAFRRGGMYSGVLHMRGIPKEIISARHEMAADMRKWLETNSVDSIFAYNAFLVRHACYNHKYERRSAERRQLFP